MANPRRTSAAAVPPASPPKLAVRAALIGALGLLIAGQALAAGPTGLYFGASLGRSRTRYGPQLFRLGGSDFAYKLVGGFRPLSVLATEVSYDSFGRVSGPAGHADASGVDVSLLGFLPLPHVDLYGKVGWIMWSTQTNTPLVSFKSSGSDLSYGIGAGTHFGPLSARLEFERFSLAPASSLNLVSVGVLWTFF